MSPWQGARPPQIAADRQVGSQLVGKGSRVAPAGFDASVPYANSTPALVSTNVPPRSALLSSSSANGSYSPRLAALPNPPPPPPQPVSPHHRRPPHTRPPSLPALSLR